jgi:hypothetical protein
MPEPVEIALTQLVLWYDATRVQTWPAFLAQVPQDVALKSPTEFGRQFAMKRMTDDRHAAAEKLTRNLAGLEESNGRLILRGLGLLERHERLYRLSDAGRQLADAYQADKEGRGWARLLALLLITREPRTRVLFALLSEPGACLYFDSNTWFGGSLRKAKIETPGSTPLAPFAASPGGSSLRDAIQERSWWALGAWRSQDCLLGAGDCRFVGQFTDVFSMHDISLALRASFEALLHVGVVRAERGQCWVDHEVAVDEFGVSVAGEFGIMPLRADPEPLPQLLAALIEKLRSDTGYVIASHLRDELQQRGIENPDREIARLEAAGVVRIEAEDYGQRRHGIGLYSDPRKQLIKIRVVAGGNL